MRPCYLESSLLLEKKLSSNIISPYAHSQVCMPQCMKSGNFQWVFRSRCRLFEKLGKFIMAS